MTAATHLPRLDEIGDGDRDRVGGKAFALARLRRAGLPVPDGFVVPAGAGADGSVDAACAALGGPFAVRSSAAGEDGAEASFAGQYRTELDVPDAGGVRAAIARCRADAGLAAGYARALGAEGGALAVLVQRFVEPRAAGVAFTRDPRDAAVMLIEAHAGRGDALVSGRVSPDRYAVDRATLAPRDAASGCLSAADLAAVAALAARAETLFGAPQDVEWAIGGEGPVLLQSRPITVASAPVLHPRIRRLTRANVGEVLPGPVTELTETSVLRFLEIGFATVAARAGLSAMPGVPFLAVHDRYVYLNHTLGSEIVASLPGVSGSEAQQLLGGGTGRALALPRVGGLRKWRTLLGAGGRLAGLARGLPEEVAAAEETARRIDARPPAKADLAAVLAEWDRLAEEGRPIGVTHILSSGASAVKLSLLARALAWLAPGDPSDRVNRLTAGLDGVESAEPTPALERIAAAVRGDGEAMRWLESGPTSLDGAPAVLRAPLAEFLSRFGHRGVSEAELAARPWADDPAPVLASLLAFARRTTLARAAAADRRRADEDALVSAAGLAGGALRRLVHEAQDGVRTRERTKSLAVRFVARLRQVARRAGALLAADGRLEHADDVFHLTLEELRAAAAGGPVSRPEIARRKRRHARAAGAAPPREIDLDAPPEARAEEGVLSGIAVSAGIAQGPARVLAAGAPPRVEAGEIRVVPVLDAAYGPLLASAAGAVAEMGGLLSHGAVVARELGVPCVVDVRGATARIPPGAVVRVDGGTGRVEVLPTAIEDAAAAGATAALAPSPAADERFHHPEVHPDARESVYFNVVDPIAGLTLVASAGVRRGTRGESLLALSVGGDVLFAIDLARPRGLPRAVGVGPMAVDLDPLRLRYDGRVAAHRPDAFPPPPVPVLLAPREVAVAIDLRFTPATPAIDFTRALPEELREALRPLGGHHVEQSGRWTGTVAIEGRPIAVAGTGSRDHTWGRRDWSAADWWRLFTFRLGEDAAVHALVVSARGRIAEGGFVWRDGRAEAITRVLFAPRREAGALRGFELEVSTAGGGPLRVRGEVVRSMTMPVDVDRRPYRWLAGRPYRLRLEENFTRYEGLGRQGHGMAEITVR